MNIVNVKTVWTSPRPLEPDHGPSLNWIGNVIAWPLALMLIIHRLVVLAWTGSVTDDFTTVQTAARRFVERVPVYNEVYHHVDPHYLYNPGATLLLSPLGITGDTALIRPWFIAANAFAVVLALGILTRLMGHKLSSALFPVSLAFAFATESVTNTLVFSNINGVMLLALVVFLQLLVNEKSWAAGIVVGLAIVVKPMFLPLLFLPLVRLDWKALVGGLGVPALLNAVAWPLVPGANDYVTKVVPYLSQTRDYANSSLAGFAVYFGMPGWMETLLWVLFAAAVAIATIGLAKFRYSDPLLWATTTSAVLLTGVFLLSSLGQAYYSMMLFPALFTVVRRISLFHNPIPWLGAFLCLAPLEWLSPHFPQMGKWLSYFLPTAGWAVLIVASATWVVLVSLTGKKEGDNHGQLSRSHGSTVAGEA